LNELENSKICSPELKRFSAASAKIERDHFLLVFSRARVAKNIFPHTSDKVG
jgi:hypothetical protein